MAAGLILLPNAQASDMSGDLRRGGRHLFSIAYGNNSFHEASPELVSKSQDELRMRSFQKGLY
jgi:hypothetical protein